VDKIENGDHISGDGPVLTYGPAVQINLLKHIMDIAKKTGTEVHGPISLPTKRMRITTRKSPCGDGKASFDNFEMRVHKKLLDVGVDERALRLIMRVPLPKVINIEINLLALLKK
jgi:small subunit ribosomal protein S10